MLCNHHSKLFAEALCDIRIIHLINVYLMTSSVWVTFVYFTNKMQLPAFLWRLYVIIGHLVIRYLPWLHSVSLALKSWTHKDMKIHSIINYFRTSTSPLDLHFVLHPSKDIRKKWIQSIHGTTRTIYIRLRDVSSYDNLRKHVAKTFDYFNIYVPYNAWLIELHPVTVFNVIL